MSNAHRIWEALEKMVGAELCPFFMFMGEAKSEVADGGVLFLYKHRDTRRYLNLDEDGKSFAYILGHYEPIANVEALTHVFG